METKDFAAEDIALLYAFIGPDDLDLIRPATSEVAAACGRLWLKPNILVRVALCEGAMVGEAHLRFNPDKRTAELGYAVSTRCRKQGLATRLALEVIARARNVQPGVEIWAKTTERNAASIRVLEKAGFTRQAQADRAVFEGALRDDDCFFYLKSDTDGG